MKTTTYNPSPLEVKITNCIGENKEELNRKINGWSITHIEQKIDADNPALRIHVKDDDGDEHLLVINLMQNLAETYKYLF